MHIACRVQTGPRSTWHAYAHSYIRTDVCVQCHSQCIHPADRFQDSSLDWLFDWLFWDSKFFKTFLRKGEKSDTAETKVYAVWCWKELWVPHQRLHTHSQKRELRKWWYPNVTSILNMSPFISFFRLYCCLRATMLRGPVELLSGIQI